MKCFSPIKVGLLLFLNDRFILLKKERGEETKTETFYFPFYQLQWPPGRGGLNHQVYRRDVPPGCFALYSDVLHTLNLGGGGGATRMSRGVSGSSKNSRD